MSRFIPLDRSLSREFIEDNANSLYPQGYERSYEQTLVNYTTILNFIWEKPENVQNIYI